MLRRLVDVSLAALVGMAVFCAAANAKDDEDVDRAIRKGTVQNQLAPDSRTQSSPERVIIIDGERYTELVPPLPSKDPFGRPIHTTAQRALATTAGVPISSVQMKGISSAVNSVTNPWGRWNYILSNGQIDNECDKLSNKIVLVDGTTTAYYTLHYFRTARTDWIGTGWIYHSSASSNEYVWNSTFKQGEVVQSYGYTWKSGVSTGAWGPTVTVAQATKNAPSWAVKGFLWVSKKIINILIGKSSLEIPFDEIASWGFSWLLDSLVDSSVNIQIVDENGNPLQGLAATADKYNVITYTYSYLGGINLTNKFVYADAKPQIKITQPNGAGSFDGNLNGRTFTLPFAISKYYYGGSGHAWGKPVSRIPLITIVFKNDGTTQVLEPRPYSWDVYVDANALPTWPWTMYGINGMPTATVGTGSNTGTMTISVGTNVGGGYQSTSTISGTTGGTAEWQWYDPNASCCQGAYGLIRTDSGYQVWWLTGGGRIYLNGGGSGYPLGGGGVSTRPQTLRITLTNSSFRMFLNGELIASGAPTYWSGWTSLLQFGDRQSGGSYSVKWDYVLFKNGVYPQP